MHIVIPRMPKAFRKDPSAYISAFFSPVDTAGIGNDEGNYQFGWFAGSLKISLCVAASFVFTSALSHLQ